MKPVVFLSHSSSDNERARALQSALHASGSVDTAFDVLHLRQGEEYRPQLYRWIARCQGAVLLLTDEVMKRPTWVLQEAGLLRARTELEGAAFRLFVLIDESVRTSDVWKTWFMPLQLPDLQQFRLDGAAAPIDRAVAAILDGLSAVTAFGEQYEGRLAELVFDRVAPFVADVASRRAIVEWLGVGDALWLGIVPSEAALQALIARRLAAGKLGADGLRGLFQRLQQHGVESSRLGLLGVLQSHWVPLANAARLADALATLREPAEGQAPANVVLLHTEYSAAELVADLHRKRRFAPYGEQLGAWVSVPLGNESAPIFTERVRLALVDESFSLERDIEAEDIAAALAADAERVPTFVHVPGVESLAHVLPAARLFWPCLFVLTAKGATCARLAAELAQAAITPPAAQEVQHMRDLGRALGFARDSVPSSPGLPRRAGT